MNDDFESSKFYSYKFKNFSTIIIFPAFLLVIIIFAGSLFAMRENSVQTNGIIEPEKVINISKSSNYTEGQKISKNEKVKLSNGTNQKLKKNSVVHIDENGSILVLPDIEQENELNIISYVSGNEVTELKKDQPVRFQLRNKQDATTVINGKITSIATYPDEIKGGEGFRVTCKIMPNKSERKDLRYGMQGQVSIITGQETYFDYFKNKILN